MISGRGCVTSTRGVGCCTVTCGTTGSTVIAGGRCCTTILLPWPAGLLLVQLSLLLALLLQCAQSDTGICLRGFHAVLAVAIGGQVSQVCVAHAHEIEIVVLPDDVRGGNGRLLAAIVVVHADDKEVLTIRINDDACNPAQWLTLRIIDRLVCQVACSNSILLVLLRLGTNLLALHLLVLLGLGLCFCWFARLHLLRQNSSTLQALRAIGECVSYRVSPVAICCVEG